MGIDLRELAGDALSRMQAAGFDDALVSLAIAERDELNIAHNEPSLLRSTEDYALALTGIAGGRRATTTLTELDGDAITSGVAALFERAQLAPVDEGNAVSADQVSIFERGPQQGDRDLLAQKVEEVLDFRRHETPRMSIDQGVAVHHLVRQQILTSRGTSLSSTTGAYSLMVMGTATEGGKSSSFNATGGSALDIASEHACSYFGIADMLRETERQIDTRSVGGNFVGDVVLTPNAVSSLIGWLLQQLGDLALLSDASLYKGKVGEVITAPLLNVESRFDAAGHAPFSGDGFIAPPLRLIEAGRLGTLLPSLYCSRKTGLPHTPCGSAWAITPGDVDRDDMIRDIAKGAVVNRLSMGVPGPGGDFSGVIKNSFLIEKGKLGQALSETMIAGNMGQMLRDIAAISREHLDTGNIDYPWIRIPNLHFS